MVEAPRLQPKFLFAIGLTTLASFPLEGGRLGWGVMKGFLCPPPPLPSPSRQGEGILGRVKVDFRLKIPRLQGEGGLFKVTE